MNTKLADELRDALRSGGYSPDTERAYMGWFLRFTRHYPGRHPKDMGTAEVVAFLQDMQKKRNVAPSTQNQAINALNFLYKQVIGRELGPLDSLRAVRPVKLPVVLSTEEVRTVLSGMRGTSAVQAGLLYGCGLRIKECLRLRVRDVDLKAGMVTIRGVRGQGDRLVTLPERLKPMLESQLQYARTLYDADRAAAVPGVEGAEGPEGARTTEWDWFWVFPAESMSRDPVQGDERRHHAVDVTLSRAIARAAKLARIQKKVTAHTFRHSFATHLLLRGVNIRSVQEVLGHSNTQTTEIYEQVIKAMQTSIRSPLDDL